MVWNKLILSSSGPLMCVLINRGALFFFCFFSFSLFYLFWLTVHKCLTETGKEAPPNINCNNLFQGPLFHNQDQCKQTLNYRLFSN